MVSSKTKIIIVLFHMFLFLGLSQSKAENWIRVGFYFHSGDQFLISDINSALFTHLICASAYVNSTSYEIFIPPSDENHFSTFTTTVKQKNPSVTTLIGIGGSYVRYSTFSSMVSNPSYRKSFIDSSIKRTRIYGFQGIDLAWLYPNTSSDMSNLGTLFREWRVAIQLEAKNSSKSELILTARVYYSPYSGSGIYPIDSIQQYLNWVHVVASQYTKPTLTNHTGAHAALYNPSSNINTDYGITTWIGRGLPSNKLVLGLPYYGYAWMLANSNDNGIGAPAIGVAAAAGPAKFINDQGTVRYKEIKNYIERYGVNVMYNSTYVVNYCSNGTSWIGFDDIEAIKVKVSYAKEKKLLGYFVWEVSNDDNWILSYSAAGDDIENVGNKWRLIVIILTTIAIVILLLGFVICCYWWMMKKLKSKGTLGSARESMNKANNAAAAGDFNNNVPNLTVYTLSDIMAATKRFSIENKLGEGGYGPVYKGVLPNEQEIAVKKLSKTSTQGFEEFKNEVTLTAKLQHVNLVRLLGFCIDSEEQMLIYEYMPNKSLDNYLFDPIRRYVLDWRKRVCIIEGVTQGLLYLQEYSRLTIIHRDLKASNVLLDEDMRPKISDFGMARIFAKDGLEANTGRIVGTYGYAPPEYVKRGLYSTKSDVYSFGVLLLQIISSKRVSFLYGVNENLSLLEHAYQLWKDGKGMEFMDPSLDDTYSSCKLMTCLHIAMLCVQENPNKRPSMLEVSSMLKNETTGLMIPEQPAFSKQTDEDRQNNFTSRSEISSVNDATVSEVLPR